MISISYNTTLCHVSDGCAIPSQVPSNPCVLLSPGDEDFNLDFNQDVDGEAESYSDSHELLTLTELDIPGASLHGKEPSQLNVIQLKRWLACRGAPVKGNKPELLEK